jgi:hypothetical protein
MRSIEAYTLSAILHTKAMCRPDKVLHSCSSASSVNRLELFQARCQLWWNELALGKVIQLHINHCTIYTLDGRRVANGSLDTIAGLFSMTAVDASKTDLPNDNRVLPPRRRSIHIPLIRTKYLNVLMKENKEEYSLAYMRI